MHLKLESLHDLDFALAFLRAERHRQLRLRLTIGLVREQASTLPPTGPVPRLSARRTRLTCPFEEFGMLLLTDSQQSDLSVVPTDKKGNPAVVENVSWTTTDPSLITVEQDPTDPLKATVKAVGPLGTGQVNVTADAKIGDEVATISGVLDVEIQAGEAVSLAVNTGAPTEQS